MSSCRARVWGHGFITFGGRKVSKSEGVRVELSEAIERHGPEALRYFLLAEMPWNGDGEFSLERFDERYTPSWPTTWATCSIARSR